MTNAALAPKKPILFFLCTSLWKEQSVRSVLWKASVRIQMAFSEFWIYRTCPTLSTWTSNSHFSPTMCRPGLLSSLNRASYSRCPPSSRQHQPSVSSGKSRHISPVSLFLMSYIRLSESYWLCLQNTAPLGPLSPLLPLSAGLGSDRLQSFLAGLPPPPAPPVCFQHSTQTGPMQTEAPLHHSPAQNPLAAPAWL